MTREIKNREEVVEQLTEILMDFDKDCKQFQTDVYLYYDTEGIEGGKVGNEKN